MICSYYIFFLCFYTFSCRSTISICKQVSGYFLNCSLAHSFAFQYFLRWNHMGRKIKKTFFSVPPFYKFILTTGLARLVLVAFFNSMSDDITRLNYLAQTVYIRKTNSDLLFGWNPSRRFHFETTNSKLEKGWLLFGFLLYVRCWFEKEMIQLGKISN